MASREDHARTAEITLKRFVTSGAEVEAAMAGVEAAKVQAILALAAAIENGLGRVADNLYRIGH